MTLQGWTLPQTATGRSSLVAPPPWHYSGEVIGAEFTADRAAVARLMPDGFEPHPDGAGAVLFCEWVSSADNDPRLREEPGVAQYREVVVGLYATYQGRAVIRVPYIWVDNDVSLVRGLIQGFPKKLGTISMTRAVAVGKGARKQLGNAFYAHASSNGQRRISISVSLDETKPMLPPYLAAPLVHSRLWPAIDPTQPTIHEYHEADIDAQELGQVFAGQATLEFGDSQMDELGELSPLWVGRGFVHSLAYSVVGGRCWPA
jgi:acetoacetate decarboxylase